MLIHESRRRKLPSLTSDELAGFNCTLARCGHHHGPLGLCRDQPAPMLGTGLGCKSAVKTGAEGTRGFLGENKCQQAAAVPREGRGCPRSSCPPPAQVWGFLQIAPRLLSHIALLGLAAASRSLTPLLADGTSQFPQGLENTRGCFP